jgi:hypothetical protein
MTLPAEPFPTIESPESIMLTVDGRRFNNLTEVAEHLKSLEPEDRYRVVKGQAEKLIELQETCNTSISHLYWYIKKDDAFAGHMAQIQINKKIKRQNKIFQAWGEDKVRYHFAHVFDMGDTTWSKLRRVAAIYPDLSEAILHIRGASLWRMQHPAPGRDAKSLLPVGADFEAASRQPEKVADAAELATSGFGVSECGWLVPAELVFGTPKQGLSGEDSRLDPNPAMHKEGLPTSKSFVVWREGEDVGSDQQSGIEFVAVDSSSER